MQEAGPDYSALLVNPSAPSMPQPTSRAPLGSCERLRQLVASRRHAIAIAGFTSLLLVVVVVCVAVGASQSSDGRGGKGGAHASDVGGVWEDGNGGTFIVSDFAGDAPSTSVTVIGSANGVDFWTVRGYFLDAAKTSLSLDFATRASGSADFRGEYSQATGVIRWDDGTTWTEKTGAFCDDS